MLLVISIPVAHYRAQYSVLSNDHFFLTLQFYLLILRQLYTKFKKGTYSALNNRWLIFFATTWLNCQIADELSTMKTYQPIETGTLQTRTQILRPYQEERGKLPYASDTPNMTEPFYNSPLLIRFN